MGYSASYHGEFRFNRDIGAAGIATIIQYLRKDLRKIDDPDRPEDLYYIDLEFSPDMMGLVWNNGETSVYYADMAQAVNFLTTKLRAVHPDFKMTGTMDATGEDGEKWRIRVGEDGTAAQVEMKSVEVGAEPQAVRQLTHEDIDRWRTVHNLILDLFQIVREEANLSREAQDEMREKMNELREAWKQERQAELDKIDAK